MNFKGRWLFGVVVLTITLASGFNFPPMAQAESAQKEALELSEQAISSTTPTCPASLRALDQGEKLVIVYVFGYKDARPARYVGDRYERAQLVQALLKPCDGEEMFCGFSRSEKDGYIFIRELKRTNSTQKVIFQLVGSSATEDDDENRKLDFQKWQSVRAKQTLQRGIEQAHVVIYNGHSRAGGGPDFDPPLIYKKSKEVRYPFYQKRRSQFQVLLDTLRKEKTPPALLGLFSCKADALFRKELEGLKKGVQLLAAPHLISYQEALESSIKALDALLKMDCKTLDTVFNQDSQK